MNGFTYEEAREIYRALCTRQNKLLARLNEAEEAGIEELYERFDKQFDDCSSARRKIGSMLVELKKNKQQENE